MREEVTSLPGVTLLHPPRYDDARGSFRPVYAERLHHSFGADWAEMNLSHTGQGVIRGLHFQLPKAQAKLITVVSGTLVDVVVDLRPGPAFGRHEVFTLSAGEPSRPSQVYLPEGVAHGIATPSGPATIAYLVSRPWSPDGEHVLAHDDPALGINWPISRPLLSPRDENGLSLSEVRDMVLTSQ
ncbi:MAG: dTDP-4-dehydrorhamnose 3,5-epimerase family protein [Verrucomicrobiota bacterium JB023]|nr:dTDP-4-dehydrorhamnose 3,5-epimerase family protein [Verrucomicrobiota bacterium JB023]